MNDLTAHETMLKVHGPDGAVIGDIDVRIRYYVSYWGLPARINYNEHDHPAEAAEIEIYNVEMIASHMGPGEQNMGGYIAAWPWLREWAEKYADAHKDELVAEAGEELEGRREAAADAEYEARREAR